MKKLFALLLALCMMCGVMSAGADATQSTLHLGAFTLTLPPNSHLLIEDSGPDYAHLWDMKTYYNINIYSGPFEEVPMEYSYYHNNEYIYKTAESQSEAVYYYRMTPFFEANEIVAAENVDLGMFNMEPVYFTTYDECVWYAVDAAATEFEPEYHWRMDMVFYYNGHILDIQLTTVSEKTLPELSDKEFKAGFDILCSLMQSVSPTDMTDEEIAQIQIEAQRRKSEEAARQDEVLNNALNGEKQTLKLDNVSFDIPANLKLDEASNYSCDDYHLDITVLNWDGLVKSVEDLTSGSIQVDNAFGISLYLTGNADTAINFVNACAEVDIGMPDGDPVIMGITDTTVFVSHYFRNTNTGIQLMAQTEDDFSSDKLVQICHDIMLSARFDNVTESDMRIDAEKPAATYTVIITGNSANIRKGANTETPIITTALKGDTFTYLGESGNWYKIDVNGQIGYVSMGLSDIQ